jgi:hypothetical protein
MSLGASQVNFTIPGFNAVAVKVKSSLTGLFITSGGIGSDGLEYIWHPPPTNRRRVGTIATRVRNFFICDLAKSCHATSFEARR